MAHPLRRKEHGLTEQLLAQEFANGLTLLGQPMGQVSSAALTFAVRAGASCDPEGGEGAASIAAEWLLRGASDRTSRQLNDALDSLGCQHHETVLSEHLQLSACLLGRNLADALALYADILLRPRLEDESFEPCRMLIAQDLDALEDEPAQKCNLLLREKFFPYPLGRCVYGSAHSLAALTAANVRAHVQSHLSPRGAILAAAGRFDWDALRRQVEGLFGDWTGANSPPPTPAEPAGGTTHLHKDSAQVHIALAHRAAPCRDETYYAARLAEAVLSRGMGSRLLTEVREKRGLVYHVQSSYVSLRDYAGMFTYAATRPEAARETFDVTVGELRRLGDGIEDEELARAKTQLRSALVMQGQSTAARAASLVSDWHHLGALRSLAEISAAIEAVTRDEVLDYLKAYPAEEFTILTIGPGPVERPAEGAA
jgi:predicted Zn-dependent peptidase